MVGIELQRPLEPAEGSSREPVAVDRGLGFRPVRQEGRLVAEQGVSAPEAGKRGIVAFQDHVRTGEQEPAIGVVGIVCQPVGERSDHRFHGRSAVGLGDRIAGGVRDSTPCGEPSQR